MKVAYVQMEPVFLDPEANYSKAEKLIREAADQAPSSWFCQSCLTQATTSGAGKKSKR